MILRSSIDGISTFIAKFEKHAVIAPDKFDTHEVVLSSETILGIMPRDDVSYHEASGNLMTTSHKSMFQGFVSTKETRRT